MNTDLLPRRLEAIRSYGMRHPARVGLLLALTLAGCGDDGPAHPGGTGTVEVTTVSTGQGHDTDGYVVDVVGARSLPIGTNATATLGEVPAGDREVRLTGVRGNCTVQAPHPRLVRVVAGETLGTHFDVVCAHTPLLGRIVFYSNRDGTYNLYSMNPDGSDPVRLTDLPEDERGFYPAVSPDGSKVLFINGIGPEDDFNTHYLYVMNADGTDPVQLPPADGGSIGPARVVAGRLADRLPRLDRRQRIRDLGHGRGWRRAEESHQHAGRRRGLSLLVAGWPAHPVHRGGRARSHELGRDGANPMAIGSRTSTSWIPPSRCTSSTPTAPGRSTSRTTTRSSTSDPRRGGRWAAEGGCLISA
jgi:hypothetical protein